MGKYHLSVDSSVSNHTGYSTVTIYVYAHRDEGGGWYHYDSGDPVTVSCDGQSDSWDVGWYDFRNDADMSLGSTSFNISGESGRTVYFSASWNANNGSGYVYDRDTGSTIITADGSGSIWISPTPTTRTLTVNNGTGSGTYNYGTYATAVANTPSTGYHFTNWSGSSTSTSSSISVYMDSNKTVTANYAINTYYVAFNANGGSGSMNNETFTYGSSKNLTSNSFSRTGYTFSHWSTNSSDTGTSYSDGQSVLNLTTTNEGTVNLYAIWTKNSYYLTVSNGSGSGWYYYGDSANISASYDSSTQYFINWSGSNIGNSSSANTYTYVYGTKTVTANIGTYRTLKVNSIVDGTTYDGIPSAAGSATITVSSGQKSSDYVYTKIQNGATYSISAAATEGYTYNGVSSGSDSGTINSDTTVVLKFTSNKSTINLTLSDNISSASITSDGTTVTGTSGTIKNQVTYNTTYTLKATKNDIIEGYTVDNIKWYLKNSSDQWIATGDSGGELNATNKSAGATFNYKAEAIATENKWYVSPASTYAYYPNETTKFSSTALYTTSNIQASVNTKGTITPDTIDGYNLIGSPCTPTYKGKNYSADTREFGCYYEPYTYYIKVIITKPDGTTREATEDQLISSGLGTLAYYTQQKTFDINQLYDTNMILDGAITVTGPASISQQSSSSNVYILTPLLGTDKATITISFTEKYSSVIVSVADNITSTSYLNTVIFKVTNTPKHSYTYSYLPNDLKDNNDQPIVGGTTSSTEPFSQSIPINNYNCNNIIKNSNKLIFNVTDNVTGVSKSISITLLYSSPSIVGSDSLRVAGKESTTPSASSNWVMITIIGRGNNGSDGKSPNISSVQFVNTEIGAFSKVEGKENTFVSWVEQGESAASYNITCTDENGSTSNTYTVDVPAIVIPFVLRQGLTTEGYAETPIAVGFGIDPENFGTQTDSVNNKWSGVLDVKEDMILRAREGTNTKVRTFWDITNSSTLADSSKATNTQAFNDTYTSLLTKITPKEFNMNGSQYTTLGFIAQEVQTQMQELGLEEDSIVHTNNNNISSITYNDLIAILWKICQNQQNEIDELKSKI